jgi:hypothetical protein
MALTDSLNAYYTMDEASGTRADSHNSNDLTDNNTVGSTTGKINNAASFIVGNNEKLTRTYQPTGDFSISCWTNTGTLALNGTLVGHFQGSGVNSFQWVIRSQNSGDIYFRWWDSAANDSSAVSPSSTVASSTTYHLVLTVDVSAGGSGIKVYKNGTEVGMTSFTSNATSKSGTNTEPWSIGMLSNNTSANYPGWVDEVGVWERVLTSDEVTELYNAGAGLAYPFSSGNTTNFFRLRQRA